jgi:RNA polymerase sigma-70 factor, ECF subfamily
MVASLGPGALRFAYMQVRHLDTAEDLVQEAFAKVWASPNTPRAQIEFKRWLYRSIGNLALDHHRREVRRSRHAHLEPLALGSDPALERVLARHAVIRAMESLPIRGRQLLYLRYFEDLPVADCARVLGLNPVSARVMLGRSLAKLRRQLGRSQTMEAAKDVS